MSLRPLTEPLRVPGRQAGRCSVGTQGLPHSGSRKDRVPAGASGARPHNERLPSGPSRAGTGHLYVQTLITHLPQNPPLQPHNPATWVHSRGCRIITLTPERFITPKRYPVPFSRPPTSHSPQARPPLMELLPLGAPAPSPNVTAGVTVTSAEQGRWVPRGTVFRVCEKHRTQVTWAGP